MSSTETTTNDLFEIQQVAVLDQSLDKDYEMLFMYIVSKLDSETGVRDRGAVVAPSELDAQRQFMEGQYTPVPKDYTPDPSVATMRQAQIQQGRLGHPIPDDLIGIRLWEHGAKQAMQENRLRIEQESQVYNKIGQRVKDRDSPITKAELDLLMTKMAEIGKTLEYLRKTQPALSQRMIEAEKAKETLVARNRTFMYGYKMEALGHETLKLPLHIAIQEYAVGLTVRYEAAQHDVAMGIRVKENEAVAQKALNLLNITDSASDAQRLFVTARDAQSDGFDLKDFNHAVQTWMNTYPTHKNELDQHIDIIFEGWLRGVNQREDIAPNELDINVKIGELIERGSEQFEQLQSAIEQEQLERQQKDQSQSFSLSP